MHVKFTGYLNMRLLSQNGNYTRFDHPPGQFSDLPQHHFGPNLHACQAVALTMAIRQTIESAKLRFGQLKLGSILRPGPLDNGTHLVSETPPLVPADISDLDWDVWDVAVMNHIAKLVGSADRDGNPTVPIEATADQNLKQGIGKVVNLMNTEFVHTVKPSGLLRYFVERAPVPPKTTFKNSFAQVSSSTWPQLDSSTIKSAMNAGAVIVLFYMFASIGTTLDENGNPLYVNRDVSHAVVINAFADVTNGTIYKIYDPFGAVFGDTVRNKKFYSANNGLSEFVTLAISPDPITVLQPSLDQITRVTISSSSPGLFGHPMFLKPAFGCSGSVSMPVERIVTGYAMLKLANDPGPGKLATFQEDDSDFCPGRFKIVGTPPHELRAEAIPTDPSFGAVSQDQAHHSVPTVQTEKTKPGGKTKPKRLVQFRPPKPRKEIEN